MLYINILFNNDTNKKIVIFACRKKAMKHKEKNVF